MTQLNGDARVFWVAAHAASRIVAGPRRTTRFLPTWRLLNPPSGSPELGHASTLAPVAGPRVKPALSSAIRKALVGAGAASRDVVVLQFGGVEPDRARAALLAGLTPALGRNGMIATTLRLDDFVLEITLNRARMITVIPWVPDDADGSAYEGNLATMDLTWFTFMRQGIDTVTIDVARLVPSWPSPSSPERLAQWLGTLFAEEINPTLPNPFRLGRAPREINPQGIEKARRLLVDILRIEPALAGERTASLNIALPNGPFGIARFDRRAPGVPPEAADRLAVLVGMATEDIEGASGNIDQSLHPDLKPRRQGELAGGVAVTWRDGASAHEEIAAFARIAGLYRERRASWLSRWKEAAPDGYPIPDATIAELDRWLLGEDASAAA